MLTTNYINQIMFKQLFTKKKGGTLMGNIIRGIAYRHSNGILSSPPKLSQGTYQKRKPKLKKEVSNSQKNSNLTLLILTILLIAFIVLTLV